MPGGEHQLAISLPEGWEKGETDSGIPYYINHNEGTTHWEHPEIAWVFKDIDGLNDIKYAAYRTTMKLRAIQKITSLNMVDMHVLLQALEEMGLGQSQNSGVLSTTELEALLSKIFQLTKRERAELLEPEKCTELTLNWILKCYDTGRTGVVKVRSVKVGLVVLCAATLQEKYRFMFHQVGSPDTGLSYASLKILICDLLMLPQGVAEGGAFSLETADDAVHSCWDTVGNQPTDILNRDEFLQWILREPLFVVWLPTLHRLATAETVKHEAKCAVCKMLPIVGFRYRCLKCSNVDLCQNCFWTQKLVKNHKVTHPTREYCMATTTGDDVRDFAKQFKNKITRKYRNQPPKKSYLDYPTQRREQEGEQLPAQSPVFHNVHERMNRLTTRLHELSGYAEEVDTGLQHGERPSSQIGERHVEEKRREREEMETRLRGLQEDKTSLELEVRRLHEQLAQAAKEQSPKIVKVPVPVPTTPVAELKALSPYMEQGSSLIPHLSMAHPPNNLSLTLGAEQEQLDAIVTDLMAAFPTEVSLDSDVPDTMNTDLYAAATAVGVAIGSLVQEVSATQPLSEGETDS